MQSANGLNLGLMIVGDELLSGKRQDKHFAQVRELLAARGLQLAWVQYVGDDRARLTAALRVSLASDDVVVCCGGIGATPDDHTRQAAAAALGRPLVLHPEAAQLITQRVAEMAAEGKAPAAMEAPDNQQRLKMGEFPEGATIVPNFYNRIPGFAVQRHWFVPGFPVMAWPMIEWILDTHYHSYFQATPPDDRSVRVLDLHESTVAPLLVTLERDFPTVKVYSLPSMTRDGTRRHLELGVKGRGPEVMVAFEQLCQGVRALGGVLEG